MSRWLLIGDETALPAIGRKIEEARPGTHITSVVAVSSPEDRQNFETSAELTTPWAYRPLSKANDPSALLSVAKALDLRPDTFVWIAAEATVVRDLRNCIIEQRGHSKSWTKAGGYWIKGKADTHERFR